MPMPPSALNADAVGTVSAPHVHDYTWRDVAAYALGIGAKKADLRFLFEKHPDGMLVYPTYAVVPTFAPLWSLLAAVKVNLEMVVHSAQQIRLHGPIPAEGRLETTATIAGVYDLKRFGQVVLDTETTLDGERLFDTSWSIIVRDGGGFGGQRPPVDKSPKAPRDRDPDWTVTDETSPEQALLYRLSGDINPLHADPELAAEVGFPEGPILHGLCTFGYVGRAVLDRVAEGDPKRLKAMGARFSKPVWPGDTIVTQGWDLGDGRVALAAHVDGRDDPVVSHAWAEVDSGAGS